MRDYYVIATRYDGKLVSGFRKVKIQYSVGYWNDPIFSYPNKRKPILFGTKENAEKRRQEMPLNQGTYVRKARAKELR